MAAETRPQPRADLTIFEPVRRSLTELKAAQELGLNWEKFREHLQRCSTEVLLLADKTSSDEEKAIAEGYRQVLETYKDSAKIWDVKVKIPAYKKAADDAAKMSTISGRTDGIQKAYHFTLATIEGIPLTDWRGGSTGLDAIVKRYAIPVEEESGFKIIRENSIPFLWSKAEEKLGDVERLNSGEPGPTPAAEEDRTASEASTARSDSQPKSPKPTRGKRKRN